MMTSVQTGFRNINHGLNHPDCVELWEDGGGGLFITTPGCEVVLANLERAQVSSLDQAGGETRFAEDAESLEDWRENWINQADDEVWSISMEEFQEAVNSGNHELKLVATWIPASNGSYPPYINTEPELWLRSSPGRAAERYLGIDAEDFGNNYPVWIS
jgi:hypothetical protein